MDTPDDDEISRDTHPMSSPLRLWVQWRVKAVEVAPEVVVWLVCDDEHVQVPASSEAHARVLCECMLFAEYACCGLQPSRWRKFAREWLLRAMMWVNREDPRHWPK